MKASFSRQFYYDVRHIYYAILDFFYQIFSWIRYKITGKIPFVDEIKPIQLTQDLYEYQEELSDLNNYDYQFVWNTPKFLIKQLQEYFSELDFFLVDYVYDYGVMWCGCLTAEPWGDLDMCEETILNILLHDHTIIRFVPDTEYMVIDFKMNNQSPLHKFFVNNRDGDGQNISSSYHSMLRKAYYALWVKIKKDPERYGEFIPAGYCDNCGFSTFEYNRWGECNECGFELQY